MPSTAQQTRPGDRWRKRSPSPERRARPAIAAAVALLLVLASAGWSAEPGAHPLDYRSCSTCRAALEKALGWMEKHSGNEGDLLAAFYGGFAYLFDPTKEKEARASAASMCRIIDNALKKGPGGGYDGWVCSMAMFYLAEFCLRYGETPEIRAQLEWGAKYCAKTREEEGGWFHSPRWGGPNYALDISSVGCGYFAALQDMRSLHMATGDALAETSDYVDKVCDGRSVAYGLHGRGGFSLGASGYLLIGLTSSGHSDDPRVKGIGDFLLANLQRVRAGHAAGIIHHFGVAASLHRVGPEAYAQFAGFYLHPYLIANQAADGSIDKLPNDNNDPLEKAYAPLKQGGDFASTAILASMILLERPGAFSGTAPKRPGSPPNKACFAKAQDLIGKGSLGEAVAQLSEVLPSGSDDQLIPRAKAQRRLIDRFADDQLKVVSDAYETARAAAEAAGADGAADLAGAYQTAIQGYDAFAKRFKGSAQAGDAATRAAELKKLLAALRGKRPGAVNKRLMELREHEPPAGGAPPVVPADVLAEILAAGAEAETAVPPAAP